MLDEDGMRISIMQQPLADLLRPKSFDDVLGQRHLLGKGMAFRKAVSSNHIPNMVFYGPPGVGKTTVANIIAEKTKMSLYKLNGTTASTDDIKQIIANINSLLDQNGILLYLDEIQYLNKKQQQSLLEFVEKGEITLIASTTENPYFYIYPALLSRCTVFEFKSLKTDDIKKGLVKAAQEFGLVFDEESLQYLAISANGDMRKALNNFDFVRYAVKKGSNKITKDLVDQIVISFQFIKI